MQWTELIFVEICKIWINFEWARSKHSSCSRMTIHSIESRWNFAGNETDEMLLLLLLLTIVDEKYAANLTGWQQKQNCDGCKNTWKPLSRRWRRRCRQWQQQRRRRQTRIWIFDRTSQVGGSIGVVGVGFDASLKKISTWPGTNTIHFCRLVKNQQLRTFDY